MGQTLGKQLRIRQIILLPYRVHLHPREAEKQEESLLLYVLVIMTILVNMNDYPKIVS